MSAGTSFASARYKSLKDKWKLTPFFEFAIAIPSYPILTSVISLIPFFLQLSISVCFILLDAFVISGCCVPSPAQNNFNPPPEPVDSTTGVLNPLVLPNRSATVVANGYTVELPTILIWSLANKFVAKNNVNTKI